MAELPKLTRTCLNNNTIHTANIFHQIITKLHSEFIHWIQKNLQMLRKKSNICRTKKLYDLQKPLSIFDTPLKERISLSIQITSLLFMHSRRNPKYDFLRKLYIWKSCVNYWQTSDVFQERRSCWCSLKNFIISILFLTLKHVVPSSLLVGSKSTIPT